MRELDPSMTGMLSDSAAGFVARNYGFARRTQRLSEDLGPDSPFWREFAELGWLACLVPERNGGLGGTAADMAALMEVSGRALLVEPMLSSAVLAPKLLDAIGGADELLARLASGACQAAVAYAESSTRTDIADVEATATPRPDGSFVLSGRKLLVLGAPSAAHLLVSARIPSSPAGALSIFLVDARRKGVLMTAYRTIDGHEAADVTFDDARLPPDAELGSPDRGAGALSLALDWAAIAACAQLLGCVDEVIRISADYARTRRQFGQPIGAFQSIKHLLAEMATQALLARAMLRRGVDALSEADPARRERGVSATKNIVSRAADFVTANGIQVHGGIGMTEEYVVGHHYKRSLVLSELFGSPEFHRERFDARSRLASTSVQQSGHAHAV